MRRSSRRAVVALLLVLAAAIAPATAQDAEKHVFVSVVDKDGLPITGLTADFFAVREGGKDRQVVRVEPLKTPMHVAVMLDMAAIGAPDEAMRTAVVNFVERLATNNQVAVYGCWNGGFRAIPFNIDPAQRKTALASMLTFPSGQSQLLDALDKAARDFEAVESQRPVIVAISSEMAESSRTSAGSVIKRMVEKSIAFHAIVLNTSGAGRAMAPGGSIPESSQRLQAMMAAGEGDRERERIVKQGTASTGGSQQRVATTMALEPALSRLTSELLQGYRVTFARAGSDKIKDLQVGIMLEGVTLRATAAPRGTR